MSEIGGHPALVLPNDQGGNVTITVCAECGSLRSVLFLDNDRWFCTKCRNEGAAAPTSVRVPRPRKGIDV